MTKNTMKTKLTMYLVLAALVLLPSVGLVLNDAYGYGGGGAGIIPPSTPVTPPPAPTTPPVTPPATPSDSLTQMTSEAAGVVAQTYTSTSATQEAAAAPVVNKIVPVGTAATTTSTITKFVTYGTYTTLRLGLGERAGIVASFNAAFNRLPATSTDWNDVIKIGNGRWPSQASATAEAAAKAAFKKVYLRDANMANANDNAAVTVMAYGLRPTARNLNSEKAAIRSFKAIYGKNPATAVDWDVVRAIAYSGAKR